jgi:hypothetical protein
MPVYRLYDHWTKRFLGPCETKLETTKRLSRLTNKRRDATTNWVRMTHSPVEVEEEHPSNLTRAAVLDSEMHHRHLRSLNELIDA